jgi:hypothetical protein
MGPDEAIVELAEGFGHDLVDFLVNQFVLIVA